MVGFEYPIPHLTPFRGWRFEMLVLRLAPGAVGDKPRTLLVNADVANGEGDLDALRAEPLVYRRVESIGDSAAQDRLLDPGQQLEVDAAFAECSEANARRRRS